jgi:hypothetical protein
MRHTQMRGLARTRRGSKAPARKATAGGGGGGAAYCGICGTYAAGFASGTAGAAAYHGAAGACAAEGSGCGYRIATGGGA